MKIARVTVVDGRAHVEIEGLDVPVIVAEGQSLSLTVTASNNAPGSTVEMVWFECPAEGKKTPIAQSAVKIDARST